MAGQRMINDILGIQQIQPSQALGQLAAAKTNAGKRIIYYQYIKFSLVTDQYLEL